MKTSTFHKFLVKNRAYNKFIVEYNKQMEHPGISADYWIENTNKYQAILSAFDWGKTEQGPYYWIELNDKWKRL